MESVSIEVELPESAMKRWPLFVPEFSFGVCC